MNINETKKILQELHDNPPDVWSVPRELDRINAIQWKRCKGTFYFRNGKIQYLKYNEPLL